jgi:hypothetical protein
VLLADYLHTLPVYKLADLYDTLYSPESPVSLSEREYRDAINAYWEDPVHWQELVNALSPTERRTLIRLVLQERCQIDAFLEDLSDLGLVILDRQANRFALPDDIRATLLEYLPSLQDLLPSSPPDDLTPI